jgi:hypothetical protein
LNGLEEELDEMEREINAILNLTKKLLIDFLLEENFPKALAKFTKRFYDALIEEGFTQEEAMEIVTRAQIPQVSLPSKQ